MSRLRLPYTIAAVAALLAMAAVLASCGSGDGGGNPQEVLDSASLQGIESGDLDLSLKVRSDGKGGSNLNASLSGPFQAGGKDELPQLAMTAKAKGNAGGDDIDFDGGLVLLPNSAYVTYEGVDYEVDPTTFSFVESALEQAQSESGAEGEATDTTACQEAIGEIEVGGLVDNASEEGSVDVGGTSTTKVSGRLNVAKALDALLEVARSPACSAQVGAAGDLPSEAEIEAARSELQDSVKTARVDVYVGDDDIVRRISAQADIEGKGDGGGSSTTEIDLDLQLTGVNEEQEISAPQGNAKPLNELFLKLGVNPIELLGLLQGEGGLGDLDDLGGLGGLLEGLGGGSGGGSGGGGGNSGSGAGGNSGGGGQGAYLDCLQGARSPADLQKCAQQLQ